MPHRIKVILGIGLVVLAEFGREIFKHAIFGWITEKLERLLPLEESNMIAFIGTFAVPLSGSAVVVGILIVILRSYYKRPVSSDDKLMLILKNNNHYLRRKVYWINNGELKNEIIVGENSSDSGYASRGHTFVATDENGREIDRYEFKGGEIEYFNFK